MDSSNSEDDHTETHWATITSVRTAEPTAQRNTEPEPTATPEPEIPDSYRAARKRITSADAEIQNVGKYSTDHDWDDVVTNTRKIHQRQHEWINQTAYTSLVNRVMGGEDFEAGGESFPNVNYDENDPGYFDQDAVQEEDDFETLIRWYLPAIMHHDREKYGNAPSSRNHRFASTIEKLINDHHPEAEAISTSVRSLPAHGIFGVQDRNKEEFFLVDTTSSAQFDQAVGRIGDFVTSEDGNRSEKWGPFHEPYEGDATPPYNGKKREKMKGFTRFVTTPSIEDIFEQLFITDEWMDKAYEILRNGGSIDPIVGPIEEIIYNAPELPDGTYIGIYGTLEDTRIAVGSGDVIYEKVMYQPEPQSIDDIESMVETS